MTLCCRLSPILTALSRFQPRTSASKSAVCTAFQPRRCTIAATFAAHKGRRPMPRYRNGDAYVSMQTPNDSAAQTQCCLSETGSKRLTFRHVRAARRPARHRRSNLLLPTNDRWEISAIVTACLNLT
jgi:hypothetical protein